MAVMRVTILVVYDPVSRFMQEQDASFILYKYDSTCVSRLILTAIVSLSCGNKMRVISIPVI